MKVYLYIRTSTGEEAASLDLVKVFTNSEDAKNLFLEDYEDVKDNITEYECLNDYQNNDEWELTIRDDDSPSGETTFRGFLEIKELL